MARALLHGCDFASSNALVAEHGEAGGPGTGKLVIAARQFPKASEYPEDAATGIAAAALWGQLAATSVITAGSPEAPVVCTVRQGDAMGRPSAIDVRARFGADASVAGCWLSGQVVSGGLR